MKNFIILIMFLLMCPAAYGATSISGAPQATFPLDENNYIPMVESDNGSTGTWAKVPFPVNPEHVLSGNGFISVPGANYIDITEGPYNAIPDDGLDDTVAIQAAVDAAELISGTVYIPYGDWNLNSTVFVPYNVSVVGIGYDSKLIPLATASFTEGFMMRLNTTSGDSWDQAYPPKQGTIFGLHFDNTLTYSTPNRGMKIGSKQKIDSIITSMLHQSYGWVSDYLDAKNLSRCQIRQSMATVTHAISVDESPNLGEGLSFDQVSVGFNQDETVKADRKALKVTMSRGGAITKPILNGEVLIEQSSITISDLYSEFFGDAPSIILDNNTNVHIENSLIEVGDNTGIIIKRSAGKINLGSVELDGVEFSRLTREQTASGTGADISIRDHWVTIKNCYRSFSTGSVQWNNTLGLYILNGDTGLGLDDFNNRSFFLSDYCQIRDTQVMDYHHTVQGGSGAETNGIPPITTTTTMDWELATDTYYYRIQYMQDMERLIGVTSEEESVALTSGGDVPYLNAQPQNHEKTGTWVIYRGTTSDLYDFKAVVPAKYSYAHMDVGSNVYGFPWVARTPGVVDDINEDLAVYMFVSRDNVEVYADTVVAPSYGTWTVNDKIIDASPSTGSVTSVVCTGAGAPGTWANEIASGAIGADSGISYGSGIVTITDEYRASGVQPSIKFDETDDSAGMSMSVDAGLFKISSIGAGYGVASTTPVHIWLDAPSSSWIFKTDGDLDMSGGAIRIGDTTSVDNGFIKWDGNDFSFRDNGIYYTRNTMEKFTADPCGTYAEGFMFYNNTSDYMCFCDGAGDDLRVHAPTTACF